MKSELKNYVGKFYETPRGVKFKVIGWTPAIDKDPEHLLVWIDGRSNQERAVLEESLLKCREIESL